MRADRFLATLAGLTMAVATVTGCIFGPPSRGQTGDPPSGGSGGSAAGGASGAGSAGGVTGSGGVPDTGGAPGSGGAPGGGGILGSGGAKGGAGGGVALGNGGTGAGGVGGSSMTGQGGATGTGGSSTAGQGGATGVGGSSKVGQGGATGGVTGNGGGSAGRGGAGGTAGSSGTNCALGPGFQWSSTDALMDPVSDGSHSLVAIRDPTVVYYNSKYTLYATVITSAGNPTIEAVNFTDWSQAGYATVSYLDNSSSFTGAHASPQLFYVNGQKKWYLVTQASGPSYSTASDPAQSTGWTKPTAFFSGTPSIVTQNAGSGPGWTDFWVICDGNNCHMFFGNNNGYLFRSQTSLANFPSGFGTPVQVMKGASANDIYGGVSVYKVKGATKFLLLVEAAGSNGHYIRSWTADALDGTWTAIADTESNPFAGLADVSFSSTSAWTKDIAEGELLRDGYDETMTVNPCGMQYVYQGRNAYSTAAPTLYPWKLALLTRTN